MAKNIQYDVHPDFKHYPAFPFPFNGLLIAILNKFLHLDTFFRKRKVLAKAKCHVMTTEDGAKIKIYQFNPDKHGGGKLPAVIYYHGGAFVLSYASTHVEAMDIYANQAKCAVFMVDYRLAPKDPFPKGFNDCYEALEYVKDNADSLGVDGSKLAVMGDSAGGALAAGVAQSVKDKRGPALSGQALIYPALDHTCSTRTAREYEKAPMFDAIANKKMWQVYLKDFPGDVPAYAAPADRQDLSGLPKAYVENAEFDPLCDEALEYARRLKAAKVPVLLHETKGTVHGYDTVPESDITKEAFRKRIAFLKVIFS